MAPLDRLHTSYYGPILYHFRDRAKYWSKIAIFFTSHLYATPLLGGGHVGMSPKRFVRKT